jgi:hypothetical protein
MSDSQKHILLERAHSYRPASQERNPPGCHYEFVTGAWVIDRTGELLIDSKGRPHPVSKKNDFETGEDQKGQ